MAAGTISAISSIAGSGSEAKKTETTKSPKVVDDGGSSGDYGETVSTTSQSLGLVGDALDSIGLNVSSWVDLALNQEAKEQEKINAEKWKDRMWAQEQKTYRDNQIKYGNEFALKELQLRTGMAADKINQTFSNLSQRQQLLQGAVGTEADQQMKKNMAAFMKGFSGSMAGVY